MAFIDTAEIDEVRKSADIVDIISSYIPLTSKGKNYFGVCPFHADHSPSMSVSKDKQIYKCFSCGASGNVFTFVKDYENVSFYEAVSIVASKVGMTLKGNYTTTKKSIYEKEYGLMNLATKYYENNLNTEYGSEARAYLSKRNINEDIIKEFDIGLSFDSSDSLTKLLLKKDYTEKELIDVGVASLSEYGLHDYFRGRIMFPIKSSSGDVVGYSARIYRGEETSKYVNSKENKIFEKGHLLFNFDKASMEAKKSKELIIVEGQMDAIRVYASGIKNVVALMGTSLTKDQIEIIKKLRAKVILCLDNDEAGSKATLLNGEALEKNDIEVLVIRLTDEKDPDSYITKKGVDAFLGNLKHPLKYFDFKLQVLKNKDNINTNEGLASYVNDVIAYLNTIDDDILKSITLKNLSKEYDLDYDILKSKITKKEKNAPKIEIKEVKVSKNKKKETNKKILYFMMNSPKYIKEYEENLGYFEDNEDQNIALLIQGYYAIYKTINLADFLSYAETRDNYIDYINEIVKDSSIEDLSDEVFREYINSVNKNMNQDEINKIKNELKNVDENQKIELLKKLTELKKESVKYERN